MASVLIQDTGVTTLVDRATGTVQLTRDSGSTIYVIPTPTDFDWILATGVWNDAGAWDDTDVWKDS